MNALGVRYYAMFDRSVLASRLAQTRRQKASELGRELTQSEVAAAADVSRSHVAAAETGHTGISLEAAFKLAQFYDSSLDYLTGLSSAQLPTTGEFVKDPTERSLLRAWRVMTEQERESLRVLFARMAQSDTDAA